MNKLKSKTVETKVMFQNDPLWQRLQSFSLDKAGAYFPFSKKLATAENWTEDFTNKAIEEYKKFVYLCCVLPNGAAPSETVDKVWHMHLIYTHNYWEEFCPHVLKYSLHHCPSDGGNAENHKHRKWFQDTLKKYKEIFQQEPPEEFWIRKEEPKKRINYFRNRYTWVFSSSILLFFVSCSDEVSDFFSIISGILPFVLIVGFLIFIIYNSSKNSGKNKSDNSSSSDCGGSSCGGNHHDSSSCSSDSSCGSDCGGD